MKCGKCESMTRTEIPDTSSVAEKQQQLLLHREDIHPKVYGQEEGCQVGQFICLGQAPDWDTADSACELCYNHFRSCMKKKPLAWCQGEVCQYDTDTGNN